MANFRQKIEALKTARRSAEFYCGWTAAKEAACEIADEADKLIAEMAIENASLKADLAQLSRINTRMAADIAKVEELCGVPEAESGQPIVALVRETLEAKDRMILAKEADLERARSLLADCNTTALKRGDKYLCDAIDNDGIPYQSYALADALASPAKSSGNSVCEECEKLRSRLANIRGWLESVLPEDIAVEAFREMPAPSVNFEQLTARASPAAEPALSPEVLAFARLMQAKLDKNAHKDGEGWDRDSTGKRGWKGCSLPWLFARLLDEVHELQDALHSGQEIELEAADVANMAMMVADVAGGLSKTKEEASV